MLSKEDIFTNHLSLTVVKNDEFCEEKALGCMEINELKIIVFCETEGGLITFRLKNLQQD